VSALAARATAVRPVDASDAGPIGQEIALEGVGKRFQLEGREIEALEDVTLRVAPGEFCSLIGPSGCGKSTLLRIVAALLPPSAGSVTVGGESATAARERRDLGFVFQDPVLLPWRTALENVELPMQVARALPGAERKERARALLELVGLSEFERAKPGQLSGGMQRRVGIARALALEPRTLLFDEPFGALDEITRQRMNAELLRIWGRARTTALLVTHNVGEAVYLSDRVLVMASKPGRIVGEVRIDLPRPRSLEMLEEPRFFDYSRRLTHMLLGGGEDSS
jgi:NitT/TauT family transport system ATP-binding protein